MERRDFLKIVGTTSGGFLFLPKFLAAMPTETTSFFEQNYSLGNRQILVVLQLSGGNDGLNTFIPYEDTKYYELRKNISIPHEQVLKAAKGGMGWHPSMTGFADMMQAGDLSVIQNVGYPNPNRSHFRSIEIWQTGSAATEYKSTGWLGRFLDATCAGDDPIGAMNIDSIENLALRGMSSHCLTMQDPQRFERQLKTANLPDDEPDTNPNLDYVRKLMLGSFEGDEQIKKALNATAKLTPPYPKHGLAQNLNWVARMIKGGLPTSVYYTSLGGFDTHANQLATHKGKLKEVSESVKAFYDDLKTSGLLSNVTLMIFSEFGRRVKDNGSGTDHGTAAPVFVIGGNNRGGIIGKNPDLQNLDNGDLKFDIDFRNLYATMLKTKFDIEPTQISLQNTHLLRGIF